MASHGLATVGLVTSAFSEFASRLLQQQLAAVTPIVEVGHPVGGIARDVAADLITDAVIDSIIHGLVDPNPVRAAQEGR